MRVPAHEIETVVLERLAAPFADGLMLTTQTQVIVTPMDIATLMARSLKLGTKVATRRSRQFHDLVRQVRVLLVGIEIDCSTGVVAAAIGAERESDSPDVFTIGCNVTLTRSGRAVRLI